MKNIYTIQVCISMVLALNGCVIVQLTERRLIASILHAPSTSLSEKPSSQDSLSYSSLLVGLLSPLVNSDRKKNGTRSSCLSSWANISSTFELFSRSPPVKWSNSCAVFNSITSLLYNIRAAAGRSIWLVMMGSSGFSCFDSNVLQYCLSEMSDCELKSESIVNA